MHRSTVLTIWVIRWIYFYFSLFVFLFYSSFFYFLFLFHFILFYFILFYLTGFVISHWSKYGNFRLFPFNYSNFLSPKKSFEFLNFLMNSINYLLVYLNAYFLLSSTGKWCKFLCRSETASMHCSSTTEQSDNNHNGWGERPWILIWMWIVLSWISRFKDRSTDRKMHR